MESLSFGSEEREIKREREVEEERGRMWVEGGVRGGERARIFGAGE